MPLLGYNEPMRVYIQEWHPDAGIRNLTGDIVHGQVIDLSEGQLFGLARQYDLKLLYRAGKLSVPKDAEFVLYVDRLDRGHRTR